MSGIDWASMHKQATTVLEGDFNVVITDAKVGQSSTNKPMIKTTLTVTAGPFAGRKVYNNFTISPESQVAMQMFFKAMAVLTLDEAYFAQQPSPSMEKIASDITGKTAIVTIEKREWQGSDRENIKTWKSGGFAQEGMTPMFPTATSLPEATALPAASTIPSIPAPVFDNGADGPEPF